MQGSPLRGPMMRTGLLVGFSLAIVMLLSLVAANRIPAFDKFALERNTVSSGIFALFVLIPIFRFSSFPLKMFTSGMIAWGILTAAYVLASNLFGHLYTVLRPPGVLLAYGAALYGIAAVVMWVVPMFLAARHHHAEKSRQDLRQPRS